MKIWEIMKEENVGKMYKDNLNNKIWEIKKYKTFINLVDKFNIDITRTVDSWNLITLDFEEVIDWSKVPVDTKILVRVSEHNEWNKRYFAKFENGFIYAWDNGKTSFTSNTKASYTVWQQAKLYEEGEE